MKLKNYSYVTILLLSTIFWGSSFVLTKHLLIDLTPIGIIFFRLLIASIFSVTICLLVFKKKFFIAPKDIKFFIGLALFEPIIYFICETYSLSFCDPSIISVIIATIPLFNAFVARIYYHEVLTKLNIIGIAISVLGIVIMVAPELADSSLSIAGLLLAVGAVLASTGYNAFLKKIPTTYNPIVIITWQNLIGLIVFTILFLILNQQQEIISQVVASKSIKNLTYLFTLSIFCSTLAFIFYAQAVRGIGIAKSSIYTNFIPVVTLIISFILLNEKITLPKIIGSLIVFLGICLVQQKKSAEKIVQ